MTLHRADPLAMPVLPLVAAAMLGLVAAPIPASAAAATVMVRLCGGGVLHLDLGGRRNPAETPGGCHAACLRRDDEDGVVLPA